MSKNVNTERGDITTDTVKLKQTTRYKFMLYFQSIF